MAVERKTRNGEVEVESYCISAEQAAEQTKHLRFLHTLLLIVCSTVVVFLSTMSRFKPDIWKELKDLRKTITLTTEIQGTSASLERYFPGYCTAWRERLLRSFNVDSRLLSLEKTVIEPLVRSTTASIMLGDESLTECIRQLAQIEWTVVVPTDEPFPVEVVAEIMQGWYPATVQPRFSENQLSSLRVAVTERSDDALSCILKTVGTGYRASMRGPEEVFYPVSRESKLVAAAEVVRLSLGEDWIHDHFPRLSGLNPAQQERTISELEEMIGPRTMQISGLDSLGVEIPADQIVLYVSLILIAIMLLMHVCLDELKRTASISSAKDRCLVRDVSCWLATSPNLSAQILATLTLVVMPVTALVLALHRVGRWGPDLLYLPGILLAAVGASLCYRASRIGLRYCRV